MHFVMSIVKSDVCSQSGSDIDKLLRLAFEKNPFLVVKKRHLGFLRWEDFQNVNGPQK